MQTLARQATITDITTKAPRPMNRPHLDDDCANIIMSYLAPSSLVAVARTSHWGDSIVGPHLMKDVYLSRSGEQVVDFCRYTLLRDLTSKVRKLHILGRATYEQAEYERPLSFLLPRTRSLESFVFLPTVSDVSMVRGWIRPWLQAYDVHNIPPLRPLLAKTLASYPPSKNLSLWRMQEPQIIELLSMRCYHGLHILSLELHRPLFEAISRHTLPPNLDSLLLEALSGLSNTLTTLSLIDIIPSSLMHEPKEPVCTLTRVHTLKLFTTEVSLAQVALIFPNLHHFTLDCPTRTGHNLNTIDWKSGLPDDFPLRSLKTTRFPSPQFRVLQLTHVQFLNMVNPFDDAFATALRTYQAQLRGAIMAIQYTGPLFPLLKWLNDALPNVRFLHLLLRMEPADGARALIRSVENSDIDVPAILPDLEYLALDFSIHCPILGISPSEVDDLIRVLVDRCFNMPSPTALSYVETWTITNTRSYERKWWMRKSVSPEAVDSVGLADTFVSVDTEEGRSLRSQHMGPLGHLL